MKPPGAAAVRHRRAGITMIEMIAATGLATLLMIMLATTFYNFGRPALEVEARARIEQEAILAAQSLACDFGGFLADSPGRTGTFQDGASSPSYQLSTLPSGLSAPGQLVLCFYGVTPTSDAISITYGLQGNLLVRTNSSTGVTTTVAKYVTYFNASQDPNNLNQVDITITIAYRNFASTFTLIGVYLP